MNKVKLFGGKDEFAIELGESKSPKKFKLRFWIRSLPMGAFTKSEKLSFSINTYQRIGQKKESMYLPIFENKTAEEIFDYTKDIDFDDEDDVDRFEQLEPLYKLAFFGPQFTDTASAYLLLYKKDELRFIWRNNAKNPLYEAKVLYAMFCKVFDEYIEYCTDNKLI